MYSTPCMPRTMLVFPASSWVWTALRSSRSPAPRVMRPLRSITRTLPASLTEIFIASPLRIRKSGAPIAPAPALVPTCCVAAYLVTDGADDDSGTGRGGRELPAPSTVYLREPGNGGLRRRDVMPSRIRISKALPAAALLLAAVLASRGAAYAMESGGYTMEILVDGTPLQEYAARDTRYIEALKGRPYSIRFRNLGGERVAVALSVDGLNSIDARTTTALEARKWVLGPYETMTLDGWQTSASTARRFFFTTESQSYGAWLGRTRSLGLIAAAVLREARPTEKR